MKLELKVLWLEDSLGIALAQTRNNKNINLTPYYFWPKNDAWEQLKMELASKDWISENYKILTLNRISEIMHSWKNKKQLKLINTTIKNPGDVKLTGFS